MSEPLHLNPAGAQTAPLPRKSSAVLSVDLNAISANFSKLRKKASSAEVAPVVKTNAYGLGALAITRRLIRDGAKTFFVAHCGEAIEIKERGGIANPKIRFIVLGGLSGEPAETFLRYGLIPALATQGDIEDWSAEALRQNRALPCAIHIDTGMNRLGLPSSVALDVLRNEQIAKGFKLELILSHLACADEPAHAMNEAQRLRFETLRTRLPPAAASLANSCGIFLGPAYHYDLVRPGMALYGLNPTPESDNPMAAAFRLDAPILQIRQIDKGESVGYGASFRAAGPTQIATCGLGYGDGLFRALSGLGHGVLRGRKVPFVGRVSMDLVTLDVSALDPPAREGELIEFIGPNMTPEEVAGLAGTVGYEILTSLGDRYQHRYLGAEGEPC